MRENVRLVIEKFEMLLRGDSVVVGLSGGADSVALACVLRELGAKVFAAHVNHNLRGVDSDADEAFVKGLCRKLGVDLKVFSVDVKKYAEEKKIGIEEAARIIRYEFLELARAEFGAEKIAVGHNSDDNAETVLMNLCRGSGLRGLGGIAPVNGAVIRPLIETSRNEIEEYLRNKKIEFIMDESNKSNDFTRNRVRNTIIPLLEKKINPNVKMTIAKNAEFLREDCDFLETEAREAFFECATRGIAGQVRNDGVDDIIGLQIAKLTALHPAISRRVIRLVISKINCEAFTNITSAHIEIVRQLIHSQTGSEVHLPGVIAAKEYRQLIFFSPAKKTLQKFFYELKDSSSFIPEINKTVTVSYSVSEPQKPYAKCFCCDKINVNAQPLVLRTRRAGDRISLKNAAGIIFTKKMQDYFTDEKIPKSQRDSVPLLAYGDEILWIMAGKNRVNAKYESKQGIWVTIQ